MAPWNVLIRVFLAFEQTIVNQLLASPGFHRIVRRIHRNVEDIRHGRDPSEPLRPGEATEEPGTKGFLSHFVDELRNQARGKPTKTPPPGPPAPPTP